MRYRIVIEIETVVSRSTVNDAAISLADTCSNEFLMKAVYVATEVVQNKQRTIMIKKE